MKKFLSDICFCCIFFCCCTQPTNAITNGWEVKVGQFPSIVRMIVGYPEYSEEMFCSGILLDNMTVLSAADCFLARNIEVTVFIGDYNSVHSHLYRYKRKAKYVIVHENFVIDRNNPNFENDIALVFLNEPIKEVDGYIKYGKLPSKSMTKPGDTVSLVGWGEPKLHWLYASNQTIIANEDCFKNYYNSNYSTNHIRDGKSFCSVKPNRQQSAPCYGDYGGPAYFVDKNGEQWIAGIITLGDYHVKCTATTNPSVLVNIAHYLDWIEKTLKFSKHVMG